MARFLSKSQRISNRNFHIRVPTGNPPPPKKKKKTHPSLKVYQHRSIWINMNIYITVARKHTKWKWFIQMSSPKRVFELFLNPKNIPIGPQKVKNDPKIKSKLNIRIERNKDNKSCSTIWVDLKTVVEPYSNPKQDKNDPKIKSNSSVTISPTDVRNILD